MLNIPSLDDALHFSRRLVQRGLEAFAPSKCPGCEAQLEDPTDCFCRNCAILADPVESPRCPRCDEPRQRAAGSHGPTTDLTCTSCWSNPPPFDAISTRWMYRDCVSDAIRKAKYSGELWRLWRLAQSTRQWAVSFTDSLEVNSPGICPVPMAPDELQQRGFDVASLLATWWFSTIPDCSSVGARAVKKIRQTPPQAGLARDERRQNLKDAFAATSHAAQHRDWLVIDDVVTTATTVRRVAEALRRAGAERIHVLALARAAP